jgi:WD40 repeat protein
MLWDLWTHRQLGTPLGATLPSKHRPMAVVTFSPDGHTLATSGLDGFVRLWDLRTHQNRISFSGPAAPPYDLAFSPDGRRLVAALSGAPNAPPVLFDAETYRVLDQFRPLDVSDAINDASFSPDGRWLAFSHATGVVRLRNVLNSRQGPTISLPGFRQAVGLVRFSPDGRTLALASDDKTVRFVDVQKRSQIGNPLNTGSFVNWIAFSPDGRELGTADVDGTLRIWDTQTHRELGTPLTGSGPVTSVEFSPDSRTIMTTDGTVRLWSNYPLYDYIRQICSYIDPRHAKQIWTNTEPTVQYQPPC